MFSLIYKWCIIALWATVLTSQWFGGTASFGTVSLSIARITELLMLIEVIISYCNVHFNETTKMLLFQALSRNVIAWNIERFIASGDATELLLSIWAIDVIVRCALPHYMRHITAYQFAIVSLLESLLFSPYILILHAIIAPGIYNDLVKAYRKIEIKAFLREVSKIVIDKPTETLIEFDKETYPININIVVLKRHLELIIPKSSVRYVINQSTMQIKDYGVQVPWKFVFIVEYLGPLVMGLLAPISLPSILWSMHYAKRIFETVFLHSFSNHSMPLENLFKNCLYYWTAGYLILYQYCQDVNLYRDIPGVLLWLLFQSLNGFCHWYLASLRSTRPTHRPSYSSDAAASEYKLPKMVFFRYVCVPNYTFEILGWIVFSYMSGNVYSWIFTCIGAVQMYIWGVSKYKRYRTLFGEQYYPRRILL